MLSAPQPGSITLSSKFGKNIYVKKFVVVFKFLYKN